MHNMQNTVFTLNIPIVDTIKKLEKIEKRFPKYCEGFLAIGWYKPNQDIRCLVEKLWARFEPYADSHFLDEIKKHFHQRTWEMYIGNVLLEKNLKIASKNKGPDFEVTGGKGLYIECVAPEKGTHGKPDSVPETKMGEVQDVPVDQVTLRIPQAIKSKADKYKKWKEKGSIKEQAFVIAINTSNFDRPDDPKMPFVIKTLFGVGYPTISVTVNEAGNQSHGKPYYSNVYNVKKSSGASVSTTFFLNQNYSHVSGVLFSRKNVLNLPAKIGDDCFFVNNPFATKPVDESFARLFNNWYAYKNKDDPDLVILKRNYLYCRPVPLA